MTGSEVPRITRDLQRLGKAAWVSLLVLGLAALAVGVLTLAWPHKTLMAVGVLFGIFLVLSGVMEIITAFGTFVSTGMRVLYLVAGALSIMLGLFCFRNTLRGSVLLLSLWIGIGLVLYGIATAVSSAELANGWGVFLGVLAAVGGGIVIAWPLSAITTLAVFTGIWLIVVGVVEVMHALTLKRLLSS
ncbi:HdeD family acid-resistance protein [Streptomyces mobaraensis]|uniref:HdeD family acid-resistance protein n=1 Tax=Streptomyces mobaraensis TaxID=35621 RepID=UPI001878EDF5|nr:DUF308 domain-containing protein [Streptomyces mobaraensis]